MQPLPKIGSQDVALICTPQLASDGAWRRAYGVEIEYVYRAIPVQLVYLLKKYGIVPHWFFVDSIMEVCGVGDDKADELIAEAVKLDMICVVTPEGDKRQRLYCLTEGQLAKLRRIRKEEAHGYALAECQAERPDDPEHGRTDENQLWYVSAIAKVLQFSEENKKDHEKLKKLQHLVLGAVLFIMTMWATIAEATMAGGSK